MTDEGNRRRNSHEAAYLNGRRDATWQIPLGLPRRNRYAPDGKSGGYARAWDRGYDEVLNERATRVAAAPAREERP